MLYLWHNKPQLAAPEPAQSFVGDARLKKFATKIYNQNVHGAGAQQFKTS